METIGNIWFWVAFTNLFWFCICCEIYNLLKKHKKIINYLEFHLINIAEGHNNLSLFVKNLAVYMGVEEVGNNQLSEEDRARMN
jgi:hypothetical protein